MVTVYRELFRSLIWALPLTPQEDAQILCDRFEGSEALLPTLQSILIARTAGSIRFVDSVLEKPWHRKGRSGHRPGCENGGDTPVLS